MPLDDINTGSPLPRPSSVIELGGLVFWGIDGDTAEAGDFSYNSAADQVTVLTPKHLVVQNKNMGSSCTTSILIPDGTDARIVLNGVSISTSSSAISVEPGASLHLVLADGTLNSLFASRNGAAGLRCTTRGKLVIDDTVPNSGIVPENGEVSADATLDDGKTQVKRGDPLSVLASDNPGTLDVSSTMSSNLDGACIGGGHSEAGGAITIEGGRILAKKPVTDVGGSAGIGGGSFGDGTSIDEWITINGGYIETQGGYHAAGIGGGVRNGNAGTRCGNIRINGGYVKATGGECSGGFGQGCCASTRADGYQIILTGGTLIPSAGTCDMGQTGVKITITGGSIGNGGDVADFRFLGGNGAEAYNGAGEPIEMIQVDLRSDVGENTYKITDWQLLVDGEPYDYGAPAEFDKGNLYLWLPKIVKQDSEVTVKLTYLDTDHLDKDGNPTPVTPLPLFRPSDSSLPPGVTNDGKLRRYADFTLDADYLASLDKYYDGKGAGMFPLPLRTPDGRDLTEADKITFKYQHLDSAGNPVGAETGDGSDVGTMKFTAISTQYSNDTEGKFSESYWGHRATGQFTIWPIASQVSGIAAEWVDDGDPGDVAHPSDQVLKVSATIGAAPTVDGEPGSEATKPTCQAPRGQVQIYVDGQPVGAPVDLVYAGDPDAEGNPIPEGDPRVTAERVDNGQGGSTALFSLARAASASDFLVPTQGQQGRHEIALRFLPPSAAQADAGQPANYLASAAPDADETVPRVEVAIDPIDPNPAVTPEPDPDCADPDAPEPEVSTGPGQPADPGADPAKPGDKAFRGTIVTTWGEPNDIDPHPGRVLLKVDTPSSGPVSVTDAKGNVFEADFVRGEDGQPVRGEDGSYTLVLDPTAVGRGELTFRQEPNGAYTGSTWVYDVTVKPEPKIAPAPALSKRAENLTHPNGPTQPGDRIRYTVTATNGAAGSLWTGVVVTDPLPACLALDERSVRLDNPRAGVADRALSKAPSVAAGDVGKFSLSAPGADGRPVLSVPAGDVAGGASATLAFECTVRDDAAAPGAGAADLENVASATGKRPDPDGPDGPDVGPVAPPGTGPATPPGGGTVAPADPDVRIAKSVENLSAPDAKVTHLGDRLRYTIELSNAGAADSCLMAAAVSDPLPAGIEPVAGTIRLALDGGEPIEVPDAAYDRASRTIAVTVGDLWGGHAAVLTFECTVGEAALEQDNANIAHAHGEVPSESPGSRPEDPDPGKPAEPPAGEPEASSPPASPAPVVPGDPAEDDVAIAKTAENLTRDDGATHVGDTVRYRIALSNSGPGTGWMDAVIRDDVPEGLEPVSGSIRLALPDGSEVAVDDAAYDPATRILAVAVGHLYGGQEAALSFDALVTGAAVGADIGNVAVGYGTPPSAWDPDGTHPEPGAPFSPDGGWDAWEQGRGKAVSDPAYPPGADASGGVLDGDEGGKRRTTIAHRLAQTGDALAAAALLPAALALAAGAALLASRRRQRASR
ncbi:hypothetical protein [Adlercreutzia muris]|uniref:hypothetical protein n=1 Tax=Adlercreutzia muris TaxID=1796610 RepID=UPI0035130395